MKEKEREKNETEKKGVKEMPMQESNPRPLNLQTLKKPQFLSVAIVSPRMRIYDQTSRIYI